jgi:ribonuclease T2
LALSWSPTFCLEQDPQGKQPQCNITLPKQYRFIVHGLWPQLQINSQKQVEAEKYLNYCKTVNKNLEASIVENYFYLMPSSGLMRHQWEKHASCGNFTQQSYFKAIENLYQKLKIATLFHEVKKTQSYLLNDLIDKITVHIPSILRENIVIVCHKNTLSELRICLNNDYTYRKCHYTEVKAGRCKLDEKIKIPIKSV